MSVVTGWNSSSHDDMGDSAISGDWYTISRDSSIEPVWRAPAYMYDGSRVHVEAQPILRAARMRAMCRAAVRIPLSMLAGMLAGWATLAILFPHWANPLI